LSTTIVYFDLDYFKDFNDVSGYRTGVNVIQLTARLLSEQIEIGSDFLGHIGGDDFVVVFKSSDWESKIQKVLENFDREVRTFFKAEHLAAGGFVTQNRQGFDVFHPLVSLSVGIVLVEPGQVRSPFELSEQMAQTKKWPRRCPGAVILLSAAVSEYRYRAATPSQYTPNSLRQRLHL